MCLDLRSDGQCFSIFQHVAFVGANKESPYRNSNSLYPATATELAPLFRVCIHILISKISHDTLKDVHRPIVNYK